MNTPPRSRPTERSPAAAHEPSYLEGFEHDSLHRLARLAAFALGALRARVTLVDGERGVREGQYGLVPATQRETADFESPCRHVMLDGVPLVVADARVHPELRDDPAVASGIVAWVGVPLRTSEGEIVGTICVTDARPREWTEEQLAALTDLANGVMAQIELRQLGRRLREQERAHAELLDETEELVVVADAEGTITYANRAWQRTMGYGPDELHSLRAVDLVAPEHRGQYVDAARRLTNGEPIVGIELVLIAKNGTRHVMRGGAFATIRDGALKSTRAFYRDVTRERQGEALGARLVATIEATPDLVAMATRHGQLVYLNRAGKSLIGLPEDADVSAVALADLFSDEDVEALTERIVPDALWRGTWEGEATLAAKGGELIPVSLVLVAHPSMREDDASPYFLSVLMRDLRSRMRAEARLRESERRFRSVLERVRAPAMMVTPDQRVVFANTFLLESAGLTPAEVEGMHISRIIPGHIPVTPEMIMRGEVPAHLETDLLARGGEIRRIAWDSVVVHDESGTVTGVATIGQDVTDRRRVEALKDQVIAIVGHELRSPIGAVRGALQVLARRLQGLGVQEQQLLDMAIRNTDRSLQLASDLLDYERLAAGVVPLDRQVASVGALLAHARDVVAVAAGAASVQLVIEAGPAEVWVDESRVVQVLVNLASNAIKFSRPGGTVQLAAHAQGDDVVFRISDQGRGIPADQLEAVFDRFTQVHASDAKRGSGLGLAIARAIVREHGGRIWAESEPGRGSTFVVSLPAAAVALAGEPIDG